ncbi:carboxymuconolactone decarboxylase family protein [Celeribacter litoreus]|uniref:carboxymuconolactone decarboxylase family protein n=1 Tax=Celeribacter litoreus TaxID=2876714 RepID=UPI001CCD10FB|nr:peroxidase [Celeribacter litoreus]MCA0043417.1 peroxidase [Celeribacter litoreus]
MPHLPFLPENAGPPNVFKRYKEIYGPFSEMSQALMNGPSPLTPAQREIILAFAAGVSGNNFVFTGHSAVAYAHGVEEGLLEALVADLDTANVADDFRELLRFVRKLMLTPSEMEQADADEVFAAGWDEDALHSGIAVAGRAAFMHRLIAGCGFAPLDPEVAAKHAAKRVQNGYVQMYGFLKDKKERSA